VPEDHFSVEAQAFNRFWNREHRKSLAFFI